MSFRALFLALSLILLLYLPLREAPLKRDPWLELEKGLRCCSVENIIYRSSCFITGSERERLLCSGIGPLESGPAAVTDCGWSVQGGPENDESLLQVRGSDRQACGELWRRLEAALGHRRANSDRTWSVEGCRRGEQDLKILGEMLVETLGARLRSVYIDSRVVQLIAYSPRAGEGYILEEGPVNLQLELYRFAGADRVRIRLGIPLLHSMAF